jgi:NTP pyrophosphatase (non-canonical NTP hydrolase)
MFRFTPVPVNLNLLRDLVHGDAVDHGLWGNESAYESAVRLSDEVDELMGAASDPHHFEEELADVIIMSLSVAGHLGIDIDAEVRRKIEINQKRPWKHEVIEK